MRWMATSWIVARRCWQKRMIQDCEPSFWSGYPLPSLVGRFPKGLPNRVEPFFDTVETCLRAEITTKEIFFYFFSSSFEPQITPAGHLNDDENEMLSIPA